MLSTYRTMGAVRHGDYVAKVRVAVYTDSSAAKLGLEQIDLLILHQPMPRRFDLTVEAYRALERLLDDGRQGPVPSASAASCPTTWRAPRTPAP